MMWSPAKFSYLGAKRTAIAFDPTQLTNLFFWLDASDSASITHSSGAVSQWSDKSGSANHMTMTNETFKPTYSATAFNGKPGLTFGGDDYLQKIDGSINGIGDNSALSYAVAARISVAGSTAITLFDFTDTLNTTALGFSLQRFSDGNIYARSTTNDATQAFSETTKSHTFTGQLSSSLRSFRVDGGTDATNATATTAKTVTYCRVGGLFQYGRYLQGTIHEIIIAASTWDASTRSQVESYLSTKWATNT